MSKIYAAVLVLCAIIGVGCDQNPMVPEVPEITNLIHQLATNVVEPANERAANLQAPERSSSKTAGDTTKLTYDQALRLVFTDREQAEFTEIIHTMLEAHPEMASMASGELEAFLAPYTEAVYPNRFGKSGVEDCDSEKRKYLLTLAAAGVTCAAASPTVIGGAVCAVAVGFWLDAMADMDACLGIPNRLNGQDPWALIQ